MLKLRSFDFSLLVGTREVANASKAPLEPCSKAYIVRAKSCNRMLESNLNYPELQRLQRVFLGSPHNKDYSILGSMLGSPYFGKLPKSENCPLKRRCVKMNRSKFPRRTNGRVPGSEFMGAALIDHRDTLASILGVWYGYAEVILGLCSDSGK